jgi:hypothetical protein
MISQNPPTTPLPDDAIALMHLTIELVDLIYWEPVSKDSPKEASNRSKRRQKKKFRDMDLKAQKAYGRELMSGHGKLPFFHFMNLIHYIYLSRL